ncbi:MAG TPA: endolytic transglycosylase MltG [Magnetospirillaceae bacterium]|jgi:UPF0755 protein
MKRLLVLVIVLILIGIGGYGLLQWLKFDYTASGPTPSPVTTIIAKGSGLQQIAKQLSDAGAIRSPWLFVAELALNGNPQLQAGEYGFPAHASIASIVDLMHRGQVLEHKLTIPEGLTIKQVLSLINQTPELRGGLLQQPAEGSILPQTYFYVYDDPRDALLGRMTVAATQALDKLWSERATDIPLTDKKQALILASVVERETGVATERPHVAAVFENRLRLHMKLESDPTVIYAVSQGLGVLDRPITRADLGINSPYNTYLNDGLPPGPICNPGRAAIEAVLHPLSSDDLYFVADGSGGHAFAKTLAQHNKNVEKWRQLERGQGNGKGE